MKPTLVVRRGDSCTTVPLSREPITLGRALGCAVVLRDDGGVSREHADVWVDEAGRVMVADRDSKNGTRVDWGEVFRDATRAATRSIRVGEYEIEVLGAGETSRPGETQVRFQPDAPVRVGDTRYFPSSKRLDLNQQRLGLLMSLAERIGGTFERKQLLEQAMEACGEALGFERGLIVLKTARGEPELPVARNVQKDESGAYKVSRTLINRALVQGERAVVNNPATDLVDNLSESLVRFPICSALCVPILHRDEILGVLYGDRVTQAATYTPEDVDFLAAIAQQVGLGLSNLRLFDEHVRAQRMYQELQQARNIQRGLLPARPLRMGRIELAGHNQPSSAVGGDYFDHFDLGDGCAAFIVADVTGHGLPAALVMANLQAAVVVLLAAEVPLPEVVGRLNRLVGRNTDSDVFVTAIVGRMNIESGLIEYVSAGHHGPILLDGAGAKLVQPDSSLPLGVECEEVYEVHRIEARGELDAVLFYTDGLVEAENDAGEMLGTDPLLATLAALEERATRSVLDATLECVREYVGNVKIGDDLTLLAVAFDR